MYPSASSSKKRKGFYLSRSHAPFTSQDSNKTFFTATVCQNFSVEEGDADFRLLFDEGNVRSNEAVYKFIWKSS